MKCLIVYNTAIHSKVDPAFAVIALPEILLANLITASPLPAAVNSPSMMAIFPFTEALDALDAAGRLNAVNPWFVVWVVAAKLTVLI